ncbi:Uncharacterised protein [Candidatus Gugararchaeum adminiculabundum]|nr:Uncharacterised protein [Candidatus Gugararchaeum adminiculabundum]
MKDSRAKPILLSAILLILVFSIFVSFTYANPAAPRPGADPREEQQARDMMKWGMMLPVAMMIAMAVETPVYWLFMRRKVSLVRILLTGWLLNGTTVFILWLALLGTYPDYLLAVLVAEMAVVLIEGAVLAKVFRTDLKNAMIISLCANVLSFVIGAYVMSF